MHLLVEFKYKLKSTAQINGEPSILNDIELIVKPFKLNTFKAIDSINQKRFANIGQTLYYVTKAGVKSRKTNFVNDLNPNLDISEIPKQNIEWWLNHKLWYDGYGKRNYSREIFNDKDVTVNCKAGHPSSYSGEVKVKWVSGSKTTSKFSIGTSSIPSLEKAFKLTKMGEKISKLLEKIPFIKKGKNNGSINSGLGFYFDIIPFEQTLFNKEDNKSRYYFTQREISGGVELGLEGSTKFTIWGIPYDKIPFIPDWVIEKAKEVVKAEVYVVAKAKAGGDIKMKITSQKIVEQENWKEISTVVDPAKIKLDVELGVGAEIKVLENFDMFSVGGDASGTAKAEILSIDYINNDFELNYLKEGVWIDFTAGMYIRVAGIKYETTPINKKIEIIKPLD